MVALQILVLSVWVRVLVRQHKKDILSGVFFVPMPYSPQVLISFFELKRLLILSIFESWFGNKVSILEAFFVPMPYFPFILCHFP